jgi:(E)-4-hydroxy-3-methyl-but-2-enyl pyrophosphate reductase
LRARPPHMAALEILELRVEVAENAGYCYGVRRAFDIVDEVPRDAGGIYTLGPIIHNPQAVEALRRDRGVSPVESLKEIAGGTLVVRSHGLPPRVLQDALRMGLTVVDATCPHVTAAQERARELVDEGYRLIILGERNHPEVVGIVAHAHGRGTVIEEASELDGLGRMKRAGLVVQTTQETEKLAAVASRLSTQCSELKVFNTICSATSTRQAAARKLAQRADVMIVVGGKNSGNTRRLAGVCRRQGVPTHHVESAAEIDPAWVTEAELVGVTAGASTPDFVLREVLTRLEELGGVL